MTDIVLDRGLQQDAEFWFTDGSIILIASHVAFRVHQGVLSRYSEVFRDIFTMSQPLDLETTLGIPYLHISDSPMDLRYFLRVLYDGGRSRFKCEVPLQFVEVAAVVRLSHKYMIHDLLEDGLARLKTVFTDEFSIWKTLLWDDSMDLEEGYFLIKSPVLEVKCTEAMSAIHLARLANAPSMLPTAFYLCCLLPKRNLLRGVSLSDGSNVTLSQRDIERCFVACEVLSSGLSLGMAHMYGEADTRCTRSPRCSNLLRRHREEVFEDSMETWPYSNVLSSAWYDCLATTDILCEGCLYLLVARDLEWRQKYWDNLPLILKLGKWSDIHDSMPEDETTEVILPTP